MSHIIHVDFVSIKPFDLVVRDEPNKPNKQIGLTTMSSTLPLHTPVDHTPLERTDIDVTGSDPANVLQAMTSETARHILATLVDQPGTASGIAEDVGTSLQNARYHIERLSDAGLIEPVGTWYSAKGREMTVYALTDEELVIQFGSESGASTSVST